MAVVSFLPAYQRPPDAIVLGNFFRLRSEDYLGAAPLDPPMGLSRYYLMASHALVDAQDIAFFGSIDPAFWPSDNGVTVP